jgi:hypothetical protein
MSAKRKPLEVYCPYCGAQAELHGTVYACSPCSASIGCHKDSFRPLGRLADAELCSLKMEGRSLIDPIWEAAMRSRGINQGEARDMARQWLAEAIGIPVEQCHFSMMDNATARSAVSFLRCYYSSIEVKRARQS